MSQASDIAWGRFSRWQHIQVRKYCADGDKEVLPALLKEEQEIVKLFARAKLQVSGKYLSWSLIPKE